MKLISRETDYAVRALAALAASGGKKHSAAALARSAGVARPVLRKILQKLNKAGILRSGKGRLGGFEFARHPGRVTLNDVVRVFQGPLKTCNCLFGKILCRNHKTCPLRQRISVIESRLAAELGKVTIMSLGGEKT